MMIRSLSQLCLFLELLIAVTVDSFSARVLYQPHARTFIQHSKAEAISEVAFDMLLETSTVPILVDFKATWCGPCKLVEPLIDSAVDIYGDKLIVVKIDIDSTPNLVKRYSLRGLPYLAMFLNGKKIDGYEGAFSKEKLNAFIKKNAPGC
jgi:thioredoxin 1